MTARLPYHYYWWPVTKGKEQCIVGGINNFKVLANKNIHETYKKWSL